MQGALSSKELPSCPGPRDIVKVSAKNLVVQVTLGDPFK